MGFWKPQFSSCVRFIHELFGSLIFTIHIGMSDHMRRIRYMALLFNSGSKTDFSYLRSLWQYQLYPIHFTTCLSSIDDSINIS